MLTAVKGSVILLSAVAPFETLIITPIHKTVPFEQKLCIHISECLLKQFLMKRQE
jgi:hypothetical protein